MNLTQALLLGILQGVTEFLPVSSSGHLVLFEHILGLKIPPDTMQSMNILLHAGTLLALLTVYASMWKTLLLAPLKKDTTHSVQLVLLIIATIPAALIGILFEDMIAVHFQSMQCVGVALLVTGIVLLCSERFTRTNQSLSKLTTRSAFVIGCVQATALIPGISRSGLTMSAGRILGLSRNDALDFSFLMAVPIIAGASVLTIIDIYLGTVELFPLRIIIAAVSTSYVVSILSILFLRSFVSKRSLVWFSPYLFLISAVAIGISL